MTIDISSRRRPTDAVDRAVAAVAAGEPVVLVDDEAGDGDLVYAADRATTAVTAFAVRYSSGHLGVAVSDETCRALRLPSAVPGGSAQRVTVDLHGSGTGISAADRAATIAALVDPARRPEDFSRPGHVVPFRAEPEGLLARRGRVEAALDLARAAGCDAAAFAAIVSDRRPTEMADTSELAEFAVTHDLVHVTVSELVAHRLRHEPAVRRAASTDLPTDHGTFRAWGFAGTRDGAEHVALSVGDLGAASPLPVHIHRECLTGDVLRATSCGCRASLDDALATVAAGGRGLVLHLRPSGAIRACALREDESDHDGTALVAAAILRDLGVSVVELLDAPVALVEALQDQDVAVLDRSLPASLVG